MSNPLWKAGMAPVNPSGRPKHSIRTVKGMVERFVKRNITPNKLQKMFDGLTDKDKLNMLTELLPYVAPKMGFAEGLSKDEVDTLYSNLMEAIHTKTQNDIKGMSTDDLNALAKTKAG